MQRVEDLIERADPEACPMKKSLHHRARRLLRLRG